MEVVKDEISKHLRNERDGIALRFSKYFLILGGLYGTARLLHWLLEFPSSLYYVNVWMMGIAGALVFNATALFGETFVLEFRLRSQSVEQKIASLERRLASLGEPLELHLDAISKTFNTGSVRSEGVRADSVKKEVADEQEVLLAKYRASAERGERWGQHNLGVAYNNGKVVPKDNVQAAYWYRKAADQGDTAAQFFLADIMTGREGVEADYPEAARLYQMVANAAHTYSPLAEYYLGNLYADANSTIKDFREAIKWWQEAAKHGQTLASREIGGLFEKGVEGIIQNFEEAYFWYYVAVGDQDPKEVREYQINDRDSMARRLNPELRRQVQERATRWLEGERSVPVIAEAKQSA